ncbi:MAG: hypothetical protein QM676_12795 [Novosphingobium sp.]
MTMPPDVPIDVQIIAENGRYVLRTADPAQSLYTYDRDQPGKSNCTAACALAWPPLKVSARAAALNRVIPHWSVIVRPDGVRQWAYDRKPVYLNAHDPEGRATGDGADGVWHLLTTFPAR